MAEEKKQNKVLVAVLLLIVMATGGFLVKMFIFSSKSETASVFSKTAKTDIGPGAELGTVEGDKEVANRMEGLDKKIKNLNSDIFSDPRFQSLTETKLEEFDIGKLKVGKRNPFKP